MSLPQPIPATPAEASPPPSPPPLLFVDLDGTVLATDLLWESLVSAVKRRPLTAFQVPFWLLQGRAHLKRRLAERADLDVRGLPLREEVLEFLREQRAGGSKIVLATASDRALAGRVAAELGLFDDLLGSDGGRNLKGRAKLAAIEDYCRAHGVTDFAYVGDARADLPIWRRAGRVVAVAPGRALRGALGGLGKPAEVLGKRRPLGAALARSLRPHHWVKNLLLAVPLALSHDFLAPGKLLALLLAFVAFSACASAIYVLNDLWDLEADRAHPSKRARPFAAGDLPIAWGPILAFGLLAIAFGLTLALPPPFAALLALYLGLNGLYSAVLKRKALVDVLLLAGLYTIRILAGGAATDVPVTEWLLAFSMFFFVSLAFAKRYSELSRLVRAEKNQARGRGYVVADLDLIRNLGPSSGYLAVLVLALYINSPHMKELYQSAIPLWLLCPLLLYWVSRVWLFAQRGALKEDPVVFAIRDRVSLGVGVLAVALLALAAWWK